MRICLSKLFEDENDWPHESHSRDLRFLALLSSKMGTRLLILEAVEISSYITFLFETSSAYLKIGLEDPRYSNALKLLPRCKLAAFCSYFTANIMRSVLE